MNESETVTAEASPERTAAGGLIAYLISGWRPWVLVCLLGCVLYLPFLGSSGLWDPWETHYGEVAREMAESGNWLDPTWEHSPGQSTDRKYFYSKPVLILWLIAVPMKIFGVDSATGGISSGAEWYIRFPFVLTAIIGLLGAFGLCRRFFGARVGLLAAVILGTSAMYYFTARQAMTDMPLVGLMTAGVSLLLQGGFDERPRPGLLYAGYALCGLAVLAKGLTGFLVPGLIFLLYFIISGDWSRLRRMRVISGGILALVIAAPWYVYMTIASITRRLLDDEGKTFFKRFFLHDHLYRLFEGVHGDRGTFVYFIKQLGLGTHPWFPFMLWGGVRSAQRLDGPRSELRDLDRAARIELFVLLWALAGLALYSLSVTKFHHYVLPILPPLAVLAALWLDRFRRGLEQPGKVLVPLALVLGVVIISRDIGLMPKNLVDLFIYNYTRAFPKEAALPGQVGYGVIYGLMSLGLAIVFLMYRRQLSRWTTRLLAAGALAGAIWGGWYFFGAMSPHWSQRHLFDTYYALRQDNQPIGAYLMNWRGETFYSRNTVTQLKNNSGMKSWLSDNKNRRRFLLVEQHRLAKLKDQLPAATSRSLRILDRSCNKFYLVSIEADAPAAATE
ncbi:MAG TPA: glycosyltransferase family 39 protein [Myxococcota bacterium]|nr:glycosyltransferase family 39 protein [Myxococcota bacterium]